MDPKVVEINLESGNPTVDQALQRMVNQLSTQMRIGCRAVILIHGYGSSGVGGSIRSAVRNRLSETSLKGIVRAFAFGEDWMLRRRELCGLCKSLEKYDRRIAGNQGVTVVILR